MEYDIKTILEKIILPIQDGWKLSIDEEKLEVQATGMLSPFFKQNIQLN